MTDDASPVATRFPIPEDLYIPPGGLEIITQVFEGPLDLILYLVRKNKFDILDLPIAQIADQYAQFVELMEIIQIELAGEYLAMAATLAKIKSRLLLPASSDENAEEDDIDPRLELAQRLQEYERIKKLAEWLEQRPRVGREMFLIQCESIKKTFKDEIPPVKLEDLVAAFKHILKFAAQDQAILLARETFSVKDRVVAIVKALRKAETRLRFQDLFDPKEGRAGIVVSMLAILELINSNMAHAVQVSSDSHIHIELNK